MHSLILSNNPLPKNSPEKKEFISSLRDFIEGAKYSLTLLNLSNMFLGFGVVLELIANKLPESLLSIDISGNHLTQSQIDIIRHCIGIQDKET